MNLIAVVRHYQHERRVICIQKLKQTHTYRTELKSKLPDITALLYDVRVSTDFIYVLMHYNF